MTWLQRYGIPGVYFWGLSILWIVALYPCQVKDIELKDANIQLIFGVVAISFLPTGYFISIIQQIGYLLLPWLGITIRATKKAGVFKPECVNRKWQHWLEVQACLFEVLSEEAKNNGKEKIGIDTGKSRFLQDWVRSRNDVMMINASIIVATVLAPLFVYFLPMLLGFRVQTDSRWCWFALIISIIISLVAAISWSILSREVVRIEVGIYKYMAGESASKLELHEKIQEENKNKEGKIAN